MKDWVLDNFQWSSISSSLSSSFLDHFPSSDLSPTPTTSHNTHFFLNNNFDNIVSIFSSHNHPSFLSSFTYKSFPFDKYINDFAYFISLLQSYYLSINTVNHPFSFNSDILTQLASFFSIFSSTDTVLFIFTQFNHPSLSDLSKFNNFISLSFPLFKYHLLFLSKYFSLVLFPSLIFPSLFTSPYVSFSNLHFSHSDPFSHSLSFLYSLFSSSSPLNISISP